ncbi:WhiB family transcriptional regulator [Streptomyces sp. G44]|nr:WhiB family transcriptional regulator [Streptomyces sp. G44]
MEWLQKADWSQRAACVDEDPDLFFPVGTTGLALRDLAAAKRVCARCPVRGECLAWALETGQAAGVWGGTDEVERAALRGETRRAGRRRAAAGAARPR